MPCIEEKKENELIVELDEENYKIKITNFLKAMDRSNYEGLGTVV